MVLGTWLIRFWQLYPSKTWGRRICRQNCSSRAMCSEPFLQISATYSCLGRLNSLPLFRASRNTKAGACITSSIPPYLVTNREGSRAFLRTTRPTRFLSAFDCRGCRCPFLCFFWVHPAFREIIDHSVCACWPLIGCQYNRSSAAIFGWMHRVLASLPSTIP
jgi:hypothetical protein